MSRSNGPVTRAGGQRLDWQHADDADPSAQPADPAQHQPYPWPSQAQAAGHAYPEPGHQPAPYGAYHFPDAEGGNASLGAGHQPPFFGPQGASPAPAPGSYAPQFDRYLHAQQQGAAGYQPQAAPAPQPSQARRLEPQHDAGLAQLQSAGQSRQAFTGLRDHLRAAQYDQWQAGQGQDARNYDLGSYMPAPGGQPERADSYEAQWQQQLAYGAQGGDPQGYYAHQSGEALPVAEHPDDQDHDDGDYELEEPRRGRRGLVIAGALVGAIIVGGGLAYGYKTMLGPMSTGAPPVVKADKRPAKTQPADPGGKQFAHSDSKLMGRLEADSGGTAGTGGSAKAQAAPDNDGSGVRKVATVVVGRDGSIAPPQAEPRLPPPGPVVVPGMTIVDGFGGRPQAPARSDPAPVAPPQPAPPQPMRVQAPPPAAPVSAEPVAAQPVPAKRPPPVVAALPAAPAPAAALPPIPAPPPAAKKPAVKEPASQAAAPAARSGASGYVAVLSSQRSRMDALKTFADLQQKYTSVLQNKIPDVQEADLSARGLGTMYRVVVGPPSSREAALDLCGQLKSAGYTGCWVTAY